MSETVDPVDVFAVTMRAALAKLKPNESAESIGESFAEFISNDLADRPYTGDEIRKAAAGAKNMQDLFSALADSRYGRITDELKDLDPS